VTGMRGRASTAGPWVLAGALLAVDVITAVGHLADDYHSLLDVVTVAALVWPIVRHYGGPRLKDGDRVVSDIEAGRMEDTAWRAAGAAERRNDSPPPRELRLASGDR
jgi:hypothetical protein